MLVRDIMTVPVVAVLREATIAEATTLMLVNGFTTLPVVDPEAHLVGTVTEADLAFARLAIGEHPAGDQKPRTVDSVMSTGSPSVSSEETASELAMRLAGSYRRCLPVVRAGFVVGIVSWRDLLIRLAVEGGPRYRAVRSAEGPLSDRG